jgi:hypothetical protein
MDDYPLKTSKKQISMTLQAGRQPALAIIFVGLISANQFRWLISLLALHLPNTSFQEGE